MPYLTHLFVANNRLIDIEPDFCEKIAKKTYYLDLSFNNLTFSKSVEKYWITDFKNCKSLEIINLSHNNITKFPKLGAFHGAVLDLSNNNITEINVSKKRVRM